MLELNPAAALARFERGKARYYMADYAASAQDFSAAAGLKADDAGYQYWLALALFKTGYYDGALDAARKTSALAPDQYQPHGLQGDIYAAMGQREAAAEAYGKAAELAPTFAAVYRSKLAALRKPAAAPRKKSN